MSKEGILNGAPISYFNVVSSNPPMISLAIQRSERGQKDTARNINEINDFVVHIVDEQNVDKINQTAASLQSNQSEIELAKLTPIESMKISVPGVEEAKVCMECVQEYSIELGGAVSGSPGCDLIIGKVVQFHIENDIYENGRIDPVGLGAVSRLAGNNYAKIGEIFSIERPK